MKHLIVITGIFCLLFVKQISAQQKDPTHSDSLDIAHYSINLRITDFAGKTISGYAEIKALPRYTGLHLFRLDLLAMGIDSIILNNAVVPAFQYDDTLIQIPLTPPLSLTDTLTVRVYYHGFPQEDPGASHWGGFKWSGTNAYNLGVGFEANPHVFGRCWFPCIDDFVDRATYDYFITVDSALNHTAVCGGLLQSIVANGNGTRTCHWKQTEEIPTYLASVAVGNYTCVSDTFQALNGPVPVQIWVTPSYVTKVWTSMPKLHEIFDVYEQRFGPYRFSRVGYVSVPFNAGAMEHASNIAYPEFCFSNNNTYESLYGHELFHHWFGNLVTCNNALDMWINEGWASYAESVYMESLYGMDAAKNYRRSAHATNVRYNHIEEGQYYALNALPHLLTYGTTIYEKGATVAHSLRGQMGDSLFFSSIRAFLDSMKFKDCSSQQMCDVLSGISGMNLQGFYNSWVYTPGYPHFSVDSFLVVPNGGNFDVTVYLREKLRGRNTYSQNLRLGLTFMNSQWGKYDVMADFNGPLCTQTFTVPFNPLLVMVDPEERSLDASVDLYKTLKAAQIYDFPLTYFSGTVMAITDSAFVRVEHNFVAPDTIKVPVPGLFISSERYWKIDGIFPAGLSLKGKFSYNKSTAASGWLDNLLMTNVADSLVLLYRPSTAADWQIIPTTKTGGSSSGYLYAENISKGEFALGIWDWDRYLSVNPLSSEKKVVTLYPNPASNNVVISSQGLPFDSIDVFNSGGKKVYSSQQIKETQNLSLDVSGYNKGMYYIRVNMTAGKTVVVKLIVE